MPFVHNQAEDIRLGDDANEMILLIHNRQAAEFLLEHDPGGFANTDILLNSRRVARHDLAYLKLGEQVMYFPNAQ